MNLLFLYVVALLLASHTMCYPAVLNMNMTQQNYDLSPISHDYNGDGVDDSLTCLHTIAECHVVYANQGLSESIDGSSINGTKGVVIFSKSQTTTLSAASIDDINCDGMDDILLTTNNNNNQESNAYVVFGVAASSTSDAVSDNMINLADLDGSNGFQLNGSLHLRNVLGTKDVNEDDVQDVVITTGKGNMVVVIFGNCSGSSITTTTTSLTTTTELLPTLIPITTSPSSSEPVNSKGSPSRNTGILLVIVIVLVSIVLVATNHLRKIFRVADDSSLQPLDGVSQLQLNSNDGALVRVEAPLPVVTSATESSV
eukprot:m.22740 g.22740  ORF g.22740 m.22740 type:complete len:313 (+) comp7432_c0_seq1:152-1090(+)